MDQRYVPGMFLFQATRVRLYPTPDQEEAFVRIAAQGISRKGEEKGRALVASWNEPEKALA